MNYVFSRAIFNSCKAEIIEAIKEHHQFDTVTFRGNCLIIGEYIVKKEIKLIGVKAV